MQRAGLIIRAAEHKAVPQSEQLRLLSIAVRDLTGTELNVNVPAQQKCQVLGLKDLPEVFGFVKKGKRKSFGRGKGSVQFYSLLEIADMLGITPSEFNDFADEHNLKSGFTGEWVRVNTPQGEAREYVYLSCVMDDYRDEVDEEVRAFVSANRGKSEGRKFCRQVLQAVCQDRRRRK